MDARQTVAIPNREGTTLVAVEIPMIFCASVERHNVVPNAKHPETTGRAVSGETEATIVEKSILVQRCCIQDTFKVLMGSTVRGPSLKKKSNQKAYMVKSTGTTLHSATSAAVTNFRQGAICEIRNAQIRNAETPVYLIGRYGGS